MYALSFPLSLSLSLSLPLPLPLSFSRRVSRGARVCYRDSWQHHGPAFAAWPAIVFLVSLESIARSILPRGSTTTSASFAASYFTGAQHGVAWYLGNFAERGCSLCQQPVPRRQRIRRSLCRSCSRGFIFLLSLILLFSRFLVLSNAFSFVALVSFSTDHAFARICIFVYPCSPPLFLSCCGYPFFFSALPSASSSSLRLCNLLCFFIRNCFHPAKSYLFPRAQFYVASCAPDSTRVIRNDEYRRLRRRARR